MLAEAFILSIAPPSILAILAILAILPVFEKVKLSTPSLPVSPPVRLKVMALVGVSMPSKSKEPEFIPSIIQKAPDWLVVTTLSRLSSIPSALLPRILPWASLVLTLNVSLSSPPLSSKPVMAASMVNASSPPPPDTSRLPILAEIVKVSLPSPPW